MLSLVQFETNPRLQQALSGLELAPVSPDSNLQNRRILFAVAVDEAGPGPAFYAFLRRLRQ